MSSTTAIAWLQLRYEKVRLGVALLGVGFAVVLILMQLGFSEALYQSAARYHSTFSYDLAMLSPKTLYIVRTEVFARSRLVQARGIPGVADVDPVYLGQTVWRHPVDPGVTRTIFVVGFDPSDEVFALEGVRRNREKLRRPDVVLYDALSRTDFGPVPELFATHGTVETEVTSRRIEVVGLFDLGTSFGINASLVTSDLNFQRLFPSRQAGLIDLGLIHLTQGADARAVRDAIVARIPGDVEVLTREEFIQREVDYWSEATPIGYVFGFGVIVGLGVGGIIVYQILFADVSDHLREYATLKAMGYTDGYLSRVVLQEALMLAVLGFLPGLALAGFLYRTVGAATQLPMAMTAERLLSVLALTVGMCCLAAAMALRRVRTADPAEVF